MIPRAVRLRISAALEGYAWLWRAAHAHAGSRTTGTLRFLACVLEDVLLLGVWTLANSLTRPSQRDRVVMPALALLVVMLLSLEATERARTGPTGLGGVPEHVGSACGGAVALGAIASPGDELVAFEACANAFTALERACDECGPEPSARGLRPPDLGRAELSI